MKRIVLTIMLLTLVGTVNTNAQVPELFVASPGNDEVLRYNGTTGAFFDDFVTSGSGD